jgi:hypothetical protein
MKDNTRLALLKIIAAASLASLAGCAGTQMRTVSLAPVGPDCYHANCKADCGYLKVYTATEEHNDGNTMYYPHTGYALYDGHGSRLRSVRNHLTMDDESAEDVELPPGRYTVVADSESDGEVRVPVVVAAYKTTTVNLEGSRGLSKTNANPAKAVRTPSGQIVGTHAES